jgi:hypothetical protein
MCSTIHLPHLVSTKNRDQDIIPALGIHNHADVILSISFKRPSTSILHRRPSECCSHWSSRLRNSWIHALPPSIDPRLCKEFVVQPMPSWPIGFEKGMDREAEGATSFFSPVRRFEAVDFVEILLHGVSCWLLQEQGQLGADVDAAESKEFFWS